MKKRKWMHLLRIFCYVIAGVLGSIFAAADALEMTGERGRLWEKILDSAKNWESLSKGSRNILAEAMQRVEAYYGISIEMESLAGAGSSYQEAGLAVIGLLMILVLLAAYRCRVGKWIGYGTLTFWFLAPFCIGTVLQADSMALLLLGGFGLFYAGRRRNVRGGPREGWRREAAAALLICISLGIGCLGLRKPIAQIVESPENFQKDVKAFFERKRIAQGGVGSGKIGNADELELGKEEHLVLICEEKPRETLYLRGFTGGEYENSEWRKKKISLLEQKTALTGEELLAHPFTVLKEKAQVQSLAVYVEGANPTYRYEPYFGAYEDARAYGESFAKGEKEEYQTRFCTVSDSEPLAQSRFADYDQIVESTYLEVPVQVAQGLQEIVEATAGADRGETCEKIRNYLADHTSYTLKPGRTPVGTDSVLYFLNENRKGYCMHYAAAAAILLRLHDIPSRFVSGYVVEPGIFQKAEEGYRAVATGREVHAWAEYYVNGFGWIPFETTPGFTAGSPDIAAEALDASLQEDGGDESEDHKENKEPTKEEADETPTGEEEDAEAENAGADGTEKDALPADTSDQSKEASDGEDMAEGTGDWGNAESTGGAFEPIKVELRLYLEPALKILFAVVGAVLLLGAFWIGNRQYRIHLVQCHSRSRNERACYLFEMCCRMLKDFGEPNETADAETFAGELCKSFHSISKAQAELFYEIAEKANFSKGEIKEDELLYLKKLYRKIRREGEQNIGGLKKAWMKLWKNYDLVEK